MNQLKTQKGRRVKNRQLKLSRKRFSVVNDIKNKKQKEKEPVSRPKIEEKEKKVFFYLFLTVEFSLECTLFIPH